MPQTDGAGGYRSDPSATAPTAAPDDAPPRTQPFMPAEGPAAARGERAERDEGRDLLRDPVAAMSEPDNRSKLWLATAALTALNTLLLLGLLFADGADSGPQPVMVDGQPCLVVEGEDAGTLFCRR
ncbi:MAG TPA: hypothetical protein VNU01_12030 [Egibacteraceae bacterium]|nr:hypothetical protein [Egibacteraceae bacterium]